MHIFVELGPCTPSLLRDGIQNFNVEYVLLSEVTRYLNSVTESVNEKKCVTLPCILKGWGYNTLTQ